MVKLKNILSFSLLLLAIGLWTACGNQTNSKSEGHSKGQVKILSSFSILTDIIQEIGQDKVEVHNLVPIGKAPHIYEPKPADVKFAADADAIIQNGLNLEGGKQGWLFKLAQSVKLKEDRIFVATQGVEPIHFDDDKGLTETNPHAFISPKVGIIMAKNIRDALIQIDPENEAFYKESTEKYLSQLKEIDSLYQAKIEEIPSEDRVFVASELAFQYLAKDYGLKEGYIWAIDTEKNGTPDQIKSTISFVEKYQPPTLFVESNVDRRPMETVSKATGVPIFGKLIYSDELGKPGRPGDTYLKYLKYNLSVIEEGLSRK